MYKLIIFTLKVKSSYIKDFEESLSTNDLPDTIQFWIENINSIIWRIRTYAIDHDIHISKMDFHNIKDNNLTSFLIEITTKNYGDIINSIKVLEFNNIENTNLFKEVIITNQLEPYFEQSQNFTFRKPDNHKYISQSTSQT